MAFIIINSDNEKITSVDVDIFRNDCKGFIDNDIVLRSINNIDTISDLSKDAINNRDIEHKLSLNPYIEEVDSYITLDGKLKINIKEKTPVLRVYNTEGNSIYLQANGNFIPISNRYTPRVMIASGYINEEINDLQTNIYDSIYDSSHFRSVFYLNSKIAENNLLNSQISHIYVNSKGEYDLVPVIGDHIIKLGSLENLNEKLQNLEAYYKKNLTRDNWDNYRTINLSYKDQIVCTKK